MPQPLEESRKATIGSYRLYIEPDGKLFLNTGMTKLRVTPDEERALLDYMLLFARYFDGTQPAQQPVVEQNGHSNVATRQ